MRYLYSLIRFVPDPGAGEFVNVGAIVGAEETGDWQIRFVRNSDRAESIDRHGGRFAAVTEFAAQIEVQLADGSIHIIP